MYDREHFLDAMRIHRRQQAMVLWLGAASLVMIVAVLGTLGYTWYHLLRGY